MCTNRGKKTPATYSRGGVNRGVNGGQWWAARRRAGSGKIHGGDGGAHNRLCVMARVLVFS
jgi:hypothetical protein